MDRLHQHCIGLWKDKDREYVGFVALTTMCCNKKATPPMIGSAIWDDIYCDTM